MADLHPYDGKTRIFEHTDADPAEGLAIAARLLGKPAGSLVDVRYRLSFYSGGIGVVDRLAISIAWDDPTSAVSDRTTFLTPEEASADPDVKWLIDVEDEPLPPLEAAVRFVNAERAPFQAVCLTRDVWFDRSSGVNAWTVIWCAEGRLNFLSFDEG